MIIFSCYNYREFDLRAPHSCSLAPSIGNVLIDLVPHLGRYAEVKCIAINPKRPELVAVGANDPYIRLYDRRMIRRISIQVTFYLTCNILLHIDLISIL